MCLFKPERWGNFLRTFCAGTTRPTQPCSRLDMIFKMG